MKRFLLTLGAVLTVGLGAAFATTTDELMLSNTAGTITATISDNGGCVGTGGGALASIISEACTIQTPPTALSSYQVPSHLLTALGR